jgi:hypothetical protein
MNGFAIVGVIDGVVRRNAEEVGQKEQNDEACK